MGLPQTAQTRSGPIVFTSPVPDLRRPTQRERLAWSRFGNAQGARQRGPGQRKAEDGEFLTFTRDARRPNGAGHNHLDSAETRHAETLAQH